MADRTSRDANDPRDQLRAMNKEARAEFEGDEADDTGGRTHASEADRRGIPAAKRDGEGAPAEPPSAPRRR
jgi:hypothetical protein